MHLYSGPQWNQKFQTPFYKLEWKNLVPVICKTNYNTYRPGTILCTRLIAFVTGEMLLVLREWGCGMKLWICLSSRYGCNISLTAENRADIQKDCNSKKTNPLKWSLSWDGVWYVPWCGGENFRAFRFFYGKSLLAL